MAGDDGFEEFYLGSRHRVVTFLYAMNGDRAEAQDAAQEAYLRAWQRWSAVCGYDNPEAWVRTVAYRLCVNRWRKAGTCPGSTAMPDPMFQKLFDETAQTRWQQVSDLRDRARRRARRAQVALVSAAALAVVATSVGIAAVQLDRTPAPAVSPTAGPPTPPPSTAPPSTPPPSTPARSTPATVPLGDAVFLQPQDVGPGYRRAGGAGSGDWTFEFSASMLDCRPADRPVRPVESAERALARGAPQADDSVSEKVSRFRTGDATRYLAEVRARVAACQPGRGRDVSIASRDFAGQEALLVAVDYGGGSTAHHVLVRQGDLLAEFFVKPAQDRPALQSLGRTAAARLCAGTDTC